MQITEKELNNTLATGILQKKRIDWIDVAKGISIILVVLGHTGFSGLLADWLRSSRMPFFFIISGILFNYSKYPNLLDFINRRRATIIRPYVLFSLLVFVWLSILNFTYIPKASELYTGWINYALWFIPVLLMSQILYYLLRKYLPGKGFSYLAIFSSAIIGIVLSCCNVHLIFKIEVVFTACFFYGLGNLLKSNLINFMESSKSIKIILLMVVAFVVSLFASLLTEPKIDLCSNILGDIRYSYIAAVFGTLTIICFSKLLCIYNNSLTNLIVLCTKYTGKNSYVILAFHQAISSTLIYLFASSNLPSSASSIIRHTLMWCILILFIYVFNNYLPWTIGKTITKKQ